MKAHFPKVSLCGIDLSDEMLKQCEQRKIYTNLYKQNLCSGLPFEIDDKHYDVVLAIGCLEFVENHRTLFKEVYSHLMDGGEFLFTLDVSSKISEKLLDCSINSYSHEDEIRALLNEIGFVNIEISRKLGYNQSSNGEAHDYFYITAKRL